MDSPISALMAGDSLPPQGMQEAVGTDSVVLQAGRDIRGSVSGYPPGGAHKAAAVSVAPPWGRRSARLPLRGREKVVTELLGLLDRPDPMRRVRVLYGLGGYDKTSMALEVAHDAAGRGMDVWWVPAVDRAALLAEPAARPGGLPLALRLAAEAEYRTVLTIRHRVLGDDHPDTLATGRQLAYLCDGVEAMSTVKEAPLGARTVTERPVPLTGLGSSPAVRTGLRGPHAPPYSACVVAARQLFRRSRELRPMGSR